MTVDDREKTSDDKCFTNCIHLWDSKLLARNPTYIHQGGQDQGKEEIFNLQSNENISLMKNRTNSSYSIVLMNQRYT